MSPPVQPLFSSCDDDTLDVRMKVSLKNTLGETDCRQTEEMEQCNQINPQTARERDSGRVAHAHRKARSVSTSSRRRSLAQINGDRFLPSAASASPSHCVDAMTSLGFSLKEVSDLASPLQRPSNTPSAKYTVRVLTLTSSARYNNISRYLNKTFKLSLDKERLFFSNTIRN